MAAADLKVALLSQTSTKVYQDLKLGELNVTTDPQADIAMPNTGSGSFQKGDYVVAWRQGTYATPDLDANARVGLITARSNKKVTIDWGRFGTSVVALGTGRVRVAKLILDLEAMSEALYVQKVTVA